MINWVCRTCGQEASHIRTIIENGEAVDMCDRPDCGNIGMMGTGVPDVYFRKSGQTFEALCDEAGKPIPIMSKRHKKEVMDKLGVRECPERLSGKTWMEGTRETRRRSFDKDRPKIREVYRQYLERIK
jgi:hypothetical protein